MAKETSKNQEDAPEDTEDGTEPPEDAPGSALSKILAWIELGEQLGPRAAVGANGLVVFGFINQNLQRSSILATIGENNNYVTSRA